MKKNKLNHSKLGFSLIELSIVILVIGILVLGVTKGSAIITKARLGAAQSLTKGSPAAVIPDMAVWYETSLSSSFNASEAFEATAITVWYDNSPGKYSNAVQSSSTLQPLFKDGIINNLPTVRFDGSNDSMTFNGNAIVNSDYTIFIVEQRREATGYLLSFGTNKLGYSATTTLSDSIGGSKTVATFVSGAYVPRIITFVSNYALNGQSNARNTFINGTIGTTSTVGTKISFTTSDTSGVIGNDGAAFLNTDIAEIIIYNRSLKVDERNDVQDYLGKKYAIPVTVSGV